MAVVSMMAQLMKSALMTVPRDSGWRAIDSIALPAAIPCPMPAPIEAKIASPAPIAEQPITNAVAFISENLLSFCKADFESDIRGFVSLFMKKSSCQAFFSVCDYVIRYDL
jgi:hypothetical protein